MAAIEFPNGVILNITPLFDNKFLFSKCEIRESALGELPDITLTLKSSKDLCKLDDEIKGTLITSNGNSTEFEGYVYSIMHSNDGVVIKILCVKPDFVKKERLAKFTSMNNAVKTLYFGSIESNTQSDLMNSMDIYQTNVSNYKILTKCLNGYKKNSVYGYALGGLMINDLNNWKSKTALGSRVNLQPSSPSELTNPKLFTKDIKLIDYSKGKDPNHKLVKFYNKVIPVNKDYENFLANILYNQRFSYFKFTGNYSTRELLPINITDGVEVQDEQKVNNECFVSSRIITLESNKIQVDYTLQSINPI